VRRGRVAAIAAAAVYAVAILVTWSSIEGVNDYAGFVAGGRALLAGESPYDPVTWPTAYERLGTQRPDTAVFGYPPWVALGLLPLAPLPIPIGSLVFTIGGLVLAGLATRSLARDVGAPILPSIVLTTASWPAFFVFLQGQWGYLLFALAIATYRDLRERRDVRAGVWCALALLVKPQLFVISSLALAAFLLWDRRWRVVVAAFLVVVVAIAGSSLVFPGWWTPWLTFVASRRAVRSIQQPTFAGLAGDIAGSLWPLAWGAIVVGLALALLWAFPRARGKRAAVAFAGTLVLSVGASLYSWSYDQYLCLAAGVVALGVVADAPPRTQRSFAIVAFVLFTPIALALWLSAFARFHDTASGLVPVFAIALLVAAVADRARAAQREVEL
jgi:hypothetical protein